MSIEKREDVLVVGLGLVGSRAAAVAAAAGLNVTALERRKTAPVRPCNARVRRGVHRAPCSGRADGDGAESVTNVDIVGGHPPQVTEHFQGDMIHRGVFLIARPAQEAARNGAECRYNETVSVRRCGRTATTSIDARCRPRILIGADGPLSPVGAAVGQINRDLVDTRQVTVPLILPHDATDDFPHPGLSRRIRLAIPQRGCRRCRARPRRRIAAIAQATAHSAVRKARRRAPHRDKSAHVSPAAPYQSAGACGRSEVSEEPPFCWPAMRRA